MTTFKLLEHMRCMCSMHAWKTGKEISSGQVEKKYPMKK